jgi:hypothetical protein
MEVAWEGLELLSEQIVWKSNEKTMVAERLLPEQNVWRLDGNKMVVEESLPAHHKRSKNK